jgi:simple sugar transport system permease protein
MSTATAEVQQTSPGAPLVRSWRVTIILSVISLVSIVAFGIFSPGNDASFALSQAKENIQLPVITMPGTLTGWVVSLLMVATAVWSYLEARNGRKLPRWALVVFGILFVVGFLTWTVATAGDPGDPAKISLVGLLAGSVTLAVPLVFGSLSGVLGERSGVVNIAIEGQLLGGAFSAALFASVFHSAYIGLISAAIAGALVSMALAVFGIKYLVNQVIVGVVLNVLVSGLTGYLFSAVMSQDADKFNSPPHLPVWQIPLLSDIPIIGPILFKQTLVGYLMYVAVFVVWFALRKTRWGLRTRAVGEHPKAADTLGVNVNRLRFWNVTLGGAVAGIGGAYFTLVSIDSFTEDTSGGRGYIALAALILGRWNPIGAALAGLLFGFADNLQTVLSIINTPVPSQFMAMLPYLVTILAVAGLVGKSRGPAASGEPYVKE